MKSDITLARWIDCLIDQASDGPSITGDQYYFGRLKIEQWTIYSATTFLESCRKVVREKWFQKSGSRNLVREKWLTRKKGGFII